MSKPFYTLGGVAERWGCSHSTVLALVKSGALVAIDISSNPRGRSRYVVPADALDDFELRRTVSPAPVPTKRRPKIKPGGIIEFIK